MLLLRIDKLAILVKYSIRYPSPTSRQYSIPQWQLTFTSTVYKHTPCEKGNENCQPTMRFIIHVWEPCGPTQLVGESVKFMCILQSYQHAKSGTIDASSPTAGYWLLCLLPGCGCRFLSLNVFDGIVCQTDRNPSPWVVGGTALLSRQHFPETIC